MPPSHRPPSKRSLAWRRRLVVMVKEPRAGRVKTRLGREIGTVPATQFYRRAAAAVLGRLSASPQWETWLAVTPDAALRSAAWPSWLRRRRQGGGDLGRRMQCIFDWPGPGPIVIVGTDIPAITPAHVAAAFRSLGRHDAVLGPAPDGGYWLVGLSRSPRIRKGFRGVRWSTGHALADTVASLGHCRIGRVTVLADVDTAAEHRASAAWSGRRIVLSAAQD